MTLPDAMGQENSYLREQIEKLVRYDLAVPIHEAPGYIIGVVDGDSTYIISFGERTTSVGDSLRADDVFELGSITKTFTAVLMLRLAQQGLLSLGDRLDKYIPETYSNPDCHATLLDLLLHRGQFPKIPATLGANQDLEDGPYSDFSRQDLLEWYRQGTFVDTEPFQYSHTGYALLEIVIEQVTGMRYADFFRHIYSTEMGLSATSVIGTESLTPGYNLALHEVDPWQFTSFAASEGAKSSMRDMVAFVRVLLGSKGFDTGVLHIREATDAKKVFVSPGLYCILPKRKFPVWMHTGHTSGHSAMIAFAPKTQTGVVVLCNSTPGTGELGLLILRMINRQWKRKN